MAYAKIKKDGDVKLILSYGDAKELAFLLGDLTDQDDGFAFRTYNALFEAFWADFFKEESTVKFDTKKNGDLIVVPV